MDWKRVIITYHLSLLSNGVTIIIIIVIIIVIIIIIIITLNNDVNCYRHYPAHISLWLIPCGCHAGLFHPVHVSHPTSSWVRCLFVNSLNIHTPWDVSPLHVINDIDYEYWQCAWGTWEHQIMTIGADVFWSDRSWSTDQPFTYKRSSMAMRQGRVFSPVFLKLDPVT